MRDISTTDSLPDVEGGVDASPFSCYTDYIITHATLTMKRFLPLLGLMFLAPVAAEAHPHRHHHGHKGDHYHYARYYTCHYHPRRDISHCHGHKRYGHGTRNYTPWRPNIIFDF